MGAAASRSDRRNRPWIGLVTTVTHGHYTVTGFDLPQRPEPQEATTRASTRRDRCDHRTEATSVTVGGEKRG